MIGTQRAPHGSQIQVCWLSVLSISLSFPLPADNTHALTLQSVTQLVGLLHKVQTPFSYNPLEVADPLFPGRSPGSCFPFPILLLYSLASHAHGHTPHIYTHAFTAIATCTNIRISIHYSVKSPHKISPYGCPLFVFS